MNSSHFCRRFERREFLHTVAGGFPALALTALLGKDGFFGQAHGAPTAGAANPLAPRSPMGPAKAKNVIFLFMYGGPSHIDTFDYKPTMYGMDGKTIQVKTFGRGGKRNEGRIVEPKWKFKPYGQCGKFVSDLFPHVGTCVDDIAFLHSMTADSPIHGSALLMMNCGSVISGKPSLGSWVNYGLGSVNENLPGYVVMLDQSGGPISGAKNWTSGFMPASYQGTVFRSQGDPILNLKNVNGMGAEEQRLLIDSLNHLNQGHLDARLDNTNLAARIASYELAYKMQSTAPEAIDLDAEDEETKKLYGIDSPQTQDFGRKCLLARRLVERGVRFVQIFCGAENTTAKKVRPNWDSHEDLVRDHGYWGPILDTGAAALLADLKSCGLLDSTLVICTSEFGRQPGAQGKGRDHNPGAFTAWMAGGGIKGGAAYGSTDDLGFKAAENPAYCYDLHATALHLLGLNHEKLSFYNNGIARRLTDVHGHVIKEIIV